MATTSVRKLIKAVEVLMDAYADNVTKIAKGEEVKYPIDDKTIDTMIKIVKEMTSFEQFEKISNPELLKMTNKLDQDKPIGNFYEHALAKVKNGKTKD